MPADRATFGSDFRRFFGRGLSVLLPSILTLWILWYALVFLFNNVAVPINMGIRWGVVSAAPWVLLGDPAAGGQPAWFVVSAPEREEFLKSKEGQAFRESAPSIIDQEVRAQKFRAFWDSRWYLAGTGLLVAIALIYLAGRLLGGILGRKLYALLEALIRRVPGFKQVYPHVKQLVDMVMGEKPMAFKRVVLVQYPSRGIWSLGLVTSGSLRALADRAGPCVAIFIPSTPAPFTGFTISVPESEVIDVPLSVDEALRFIITGGVLIPERQTVPAESPPVPQAPRLAPGSA